MVRAAAVLGGRLDARLPQQIDDALAGLDWNNAGLCRNAARFVKAAGAAADELLRAARAQCGALDAVALLDTHGAMHLLLASSQKALLGRSREIEAAANSANQLIA